MKTGILILIGLLGINTQAALPQECVAPGGQYLIKGFELVGDQTAKAFYIEPFSRMIGELFCGVMTDPQNSLEIACSGEVFSPQIRGRKTIRVRIHRPDQEGASSLGVIEVLLPQQSSSIDDTIPLRCEPDAPESI